MKRYRVTFTSYEEYEIEAESENEGFQKARERLRNDRCSMSTVETHYDESDIEEIGKEE